MNLDAAKARLAALRQEMLNDKSKQTQVTQTIAAQMHEIQRLNGLLIQNQEKHKNDLKALQNTLQAKIVEERNVTAVRFQEEIKRLKDVIKQLESSRTSLEVIPRLQHELDQLRAEKNQSDQRLAVLQKSYDELHHNNQMLEDHLKTLTSDKYSMQQEISELRNQIQELESSHQNANHEVDSLRDEKNRVDNERLMLEQKINQLQQEINDTASSMKQTIEELRREKEQVEKTVSSAASSLDEITLLREASDQQSKEIRALNSNLGAKEIEIKNLKQLLERTEGECKSLQETRDQLTASRQDESTATSERVKGLEKEVRTLKESSQKVSQEKSGLELERNDLISNQKKVIEIISAFKPVL